MKVDLISTVRSASLLCDGAMGTELIRRGLAPGECGMQWNERRPDDVRNVHKDYANAGCQIITTNSFGGTQTMLGLHGFGAHVRDWNRMAASLARDAIGKDGWVFGDVGPFGDFLEPLGDMTPEGLRAILSEQIEALVAGGVDAILVETMSDPAEAVVGVQAAKALSSLPVVVTFAFQNTSGTFRTMMEFLWMELSLQP